MTMKIKKFYKVIVISVDIFESKIIDEKHFSNEQDAISFKDSLSSSDYIGLVVEV